jgi:hypothetical protein
MIVVIIPGPTIYSTVIFTLRFLNKTDRLLSFLQNNSDYFEIIEIFTD